MRQSAKDKAIFWDYDINKMDLNNPEIRSWYLTRKLQFGSLSGLSRADLKKYLPKLKINSSLKELLGNFLREHV
jgi:hypothetical protein